MSDLRNRFIQNRKKADPFKEQYQLCQSKIKLIKEKNDHLQRSAGTDDEQYIMQQIQSQKQFMQKQIAQIKLALDNLESRYRDAQSRVKIRNIKTEAQKQIERNRIILKEFINKSYFNVEKKKKSLHQSNHENQDISPNKKESIKRDKDSADISRSDSINASRQKQNQKVSGNKKGKLQFQMQMEHEIEIDYEIEKKILDQKTNLLNQVEQNIYKLNDIILQTGEMVYQQGDNIDLITDQIQKTNKNVIQAKQEIQQASDLQKKAKNKVYCLVCILLVVIAIAAGIFFILKYK